MKMAVVLLQQLVLRNTVYVCGICVYAHRLDAWPDSYSFGLNLEYVSFSVCFLNLLTQILPLVQAGDASCKVMGIVVVSLKQCLP